MEVSLLISSSVWSTAGTTVEESGLLSLATISRNLRGVAKLGDGGVAETEKYISKADNSRKFCIRTTDKFTLDLM